MIENVQSVPPECIFPTQPQLTPILHTSVFYSVCKLGHSGITEAVHISCSKAQGLHHTKLNVTYEQKTLAFFKKT